MLSKVLYLTNLESNALLQNSSADKIWSDMSLKRGRVYLGVITISVWLSVALQYYLEQTKFCGIKFCSPWMVLINFGTFFMGSVSLTIEAFSRLIWVCLANLQDSMKFLHTHLLSSEQREMDEEMYWNLFFFQVQSTQLSLISLNMYVCLWKWRCGLGVNNFDYLDHL